MRLRTLGIARRAMRMSLAMTASLIRKYVNKTVSEHTLNKQTNRGVDEFDVTMVPRINEISNE
jgi:hypothetical protein